MRPPRWLQRPWVWAFRSQRAELYRDFADMYRRNEPMMGFFEGEIANATQCHQRARGAALRMMLARYRTGDQAGRLGHLFDRVMPASDRLMLIGIDRADDKPRALMAMATAVETQQAMKVIVFGHAVFPLVMLPLCFVLIRVLSDVILAIDRSTPDYVKSELWTGPNAWAKTIAEGMQAFGLPLAVLVGALLLAMAASLPRWKGRFRLLVEDWPVYGLYRDFQSGLLFTSMAMLLANGSTLKGALEDIAQGSSPWMRWHLTRVLRALDENPNRALEAFSRGILSPPMLARATTLQRTVSSFADVLVELGTRESARVLDAVRRAALVANVCIVGVLVALCTFMGLSTLSVPGRFSALMEPSTLMSLKQAHEARSRAPVSAVPTKPAP